MPVFSNIVGTPATPQFAEIVTTQSIANGNGGQTPVVNIYNYRQIGGPVATPIANLLTAFRTAMNASLLAALSVESITYPLKGRYMDDPTVGYTSGTAMSAGTVTGDRLPLYATVSVQIKTAGRGRSYRGAKRFATVAESHSLLDNLTAGGQTLWDAVATALQNTITLAPADGSTWRLIVLSRILSDLEANPSVFSGADATSCKANNTLGTMRHRKEKPIPV